MEIKDLSSGVYATEMHEGIKTRAIGWLGNKVFNTGKMDSRLISKLEQLREYKSKYDHDFGMHLCELCNSYEDQGEFWLEHNKIRYVMPRMVIHYIKQHNYIPPQEFLEVLSRC